MVVEELFTFLDILPPSTAASILQLVQRHLFEIRWRCNRKIQSFKSKKREAVQQENSLGNERCRKSRCAADSITFGLGQDDVRVPIPKRNFRARILSSKVWE